MLTRRDLVLKLSTATALISTVANSKMLAAPITEHSRTWLKKTDELTAMLLGETISVSDWRTGLSQFNNHFHLEEMLKEIDFERLKTEVEFANLGVATAKIEFADDDVRELSFIPKLFAVGTGRAIIPHGHSNMVSAHLVASGRFYLRQYDQVALDADSMLVRPSFDDIVATGDLSSIGKIEDNVHWFVALEPSYTFDVIVTGLDAEANRNFDIYNLDIDAAEPDGAFLRVPRLNVQEALEKYG
ncbi:MAG: hypothetical protein ACE37M_14560 [Henriciella sp.]